MTLTFYLPEWNLQMELLFINHLPNDKILDKSKLTAFADDKSNVVEMTSSLFDRIENIVGKRRRCWLPEFSPFPAVFSSAFLLN